ncbi:Gamma-aminobutyric acid type B receptor subunit 2 [Stylophora pistillata]|uniref:Gamma-aminobutyric acid type B receptor subunit 2 n=1 Tax=Stylophora pistillata TaxID=50429 RepID=A0A2B4SPB3_STYPI|nr:Gamma-aminobutyric acid type B receptor subunit 2 [Stylophora pistillata]
MLLKVQTWRAFYSQSPSTASFRPSFRAIIAIKRYFMEEYALRRIWCILATAQRVAIFTSFYSSRHMFLYKKLTFVLAVTSLNVGEVSPSAASGKLSKKDIFPYFFRTVPALSAANRTFIAIAKTFAWTRVAILYQSRELFTSAATSLREECKKNGIDVISYGSFLTDPKSQIKHLKDIDARIIFGFFTHSTRTMCEIYKHSMHGRKYGWVINTPDKYGWWKRTLKNVNCSPEEVNEGAKGILLVNYMWLSSSKNETVSGMTPKKFQSSFIQKVRLSSVNDTDYKGFAYDAAWLVALALNRTAQNLAPKIRLDTVAFGERNFSDLMRKNLLSTKFRGVTSIVKLNDKGDRSGVFEISQLIGSEFEAICSHDVGQTSLVFYPGKEFHWEGGVAPVDRQSEQRQLFTMSISVFYFMCSMASFGIFLAFTFLYFNIKNRNKRLIKMSSPNLNNVIILGCILSYISVILFAFDGDHLKAELCTTRTATLCVGFTFVFGSLFSKTWRVHKVTRIISAKKLIIKDLHLFGVIGVLILIDAVILLHWNFLDPYQRQIKYLSALNNHEDDNILHLPYTYTCEVNHIEIWLGLLYSYKGILLLFGLFLAWETRNVKIPALNDSHHIGMAVYNVVIVCIVGTPVVTFVHEKQFEASFIVTGICILFSTTSTLCIVFVPKIAALRKYGINEEYRARTRTFSSLDTFATTTAKCSCSGKDTINKDGELQRLREMLDTLQREKKRTVHSNGSNVTTHL